MTTAETIRSNSLNGQVQIDVRNAQIHVDYDLSNDSAIFDVCTQEGRILLTGKMSDLKDHYIDLTGFSPGYYNLYILDGEELHRETIYLP